MNLKHAKNKLKLRKGEEFLFCTLQKIIEIVFSRLMFVSVTSPIALCMYNFVRETNKSCLCFRLVCAN